MGDLIMINDKTIKDVLLDYMPTATDREIDALIQHIAKDAEILAYNKIREAVHNEKV